MNMSSRQLFALMLRTGTVTTLGTATILGGALAIDYFGHDTDTLYASVVQEESLQAEKNTTTIKGDSPVDKNQGSVPAPAYSPRTNDGTVIYVPVTNNGIATVQRHVGLPQSRQVAQHNLVMQYQNTQDDSSKEKIKADLLKSIEEEFDQSIERAGADILQLEQRLKSAKSKLNSRKEKKKAIVDARLNSLLGVRDELAWDYSPDGGINGIGQYYGPPVSGNYGGLSMGASQQLHPQPFHSQQTVPGTQFRSIPPAIPPAIHIGPSPASALPIVPSQPVQSSRQPLPSFAVTTVENKLFDFKPNAKVVETTVMEQRTHNSQFNNGVDHIVSAVQSMKGLDLDKEILENQVNQSIINEYGLQEILEKTKALKEIYLPAFEGILKIHHNPTVDVAGEQSETILKMASSQELLLDALRQLYIKHRELTEITNGLKRSEENGNKIDRDKVLSSTLRHLIINLRNFSQLQNGLIRGEYGVFLESDGGVRVRVESKRHISQ